MKKKGSMSGSWTSPTLCSTAMLDVLGSRPQRKGLTRMGTKQSCFFWQLKSSQVEDCLFICAYAVFFKKNKGQSNQNLNSYNTKDEDSHSLCFSLFLLLHWSLGQVTHSSAFEKGGLISVFPVFPTWHLSKSWILGYIGRVTSTLFFLPPGIKLAIFVFPSVALWVLSSATASKPPSVPNPNIQQLV